MARKSGISATNLVLMGGLAALLLDRNLRDRVVGTTRFAARQGRELLEEELVPALGIAATHAERFAREGQRAFYDWQEHDAPELASRAQGLLETAQERAARLAKEARREWENRAEQAEETYGDLRKDARRTALSLANQGEDHLQAARKQAKRAARQGESNLEDLQGAFMGFLSRTGDELEDRRRLMERDLSRARRDVEKELRRSGKKWNAASLEKAVAKRLAPLHKEAEREFARFEKEVLKQKRMAERQARAENSGLSGSVVALGLLGAGTVALARMPEARTAVLEGVEKVSPDARHHLERVGRSFKASVGEVWIEGPKEKSAQAPAAPTANKSVAATGDASKDTGNPKTGNPAPASMDTSKTDAAQVDTNKDNGSKA